MKRLLPLLLCLMLLTGCAASPTLRPAKLTGDEQALLRMFDLNYPGQVFDFTAPKGTVGVILRIQHLQEGVWVASSYYLHAEEGTGRIAVSFDNLADGLHCAILQRGEVESTSAARKTAASDLPGTMHATQRLSSAVPAVLNEEIPLVVQLHQEGSEMPLQGGSLADYPHADAFAAYDHVYAVTATFTDQPLE